MVTQDGFSPQLWRPVIDGAACTAVSDLAGGGGGGTLVVLGAHPDDETIGAGRLIAHWARAIGAVTIVSMSAGEACLDHLDIHLPELADTRRGELAAAGERLGAGRTQCWSVLDGGLTVGLAAVRAQIDHEVRAAALVASPWRFDPHPDHGALGHFAAASCERLGVPLLEYPIWSTFWQHPLVLDETGYQVLRVATDAEDEQARDRAIACYRSQLQPLLPDLTPVVPTAMLAHHESQFLLQRKDTDR
ncbi:MAG: PIG-L family deacetylase [Actinomycetota bacterium]|nr:PIG-L family deacetylase [Actinomycetota bacterium]